MKNKMFRFGSLGFISFALMICFARAQNNQSQCYWIFLRTPKIPSSDLQSQKASRSLDISERSLKRRAKVLPPDGLIDQLDLPVSETAIDQIKQTGAKIRSISRWLNAVSVVVTPQQLQTLKTLPIVTTCEPVAILEHPKPTTSSSFDSSSPFLKTYGLTNLDYGSSLTQLTNIKIVDLHALGVRGTGVLIGMIDDGFNNYRTHNALKNINVESTYDFIHNINDVNRQPWEGSSQGDHGAGTLSAIGGFDNGQLIGASFGASFILAKTEMDSSGNNVDFHSEEDTYVAALEWAERLGADITSSSLGYKDFAPPPTYTTSDLNGHTTKVAQAAIIAARKGILVVTAMGNSGSMPNGLYRDSTLVSPADADSIVAVGATSSDGELASFSGAGPTADGRIKPEVVAQGLAIYWATPTGYGYANGTSCSTPLVAGSAALVLSAHPELTPMQVRNALMQTAVHSSFITSQTAVYPNNYYGYGFTNALAAALYYGPVFSNSLNIMRVDSLLSVTTHIAASTALIPDSLLLYYRIGQSGSFLSTRFNPTSNAHEYTALIPNTHGSEIAGYLYAREQSGLASRFPYSAPDSLYVFTVNQIPQNFVLLNNFPNPFNSGTTISFDVPKTERIELSIFNILGQHIITLFSGEAAVGRNTLLWNGVNGKGIHVASGVYICRLKTQSSIISKKMLYLK